MNPLALSLAETATRLTLTSSGFGKLWPDLYETAGFPAPFCVGRRFRWIAIEVDQWQYDHQPLRPFVRWLGTAPSRPPFRWTIDLSRGQRAIIDPEDYGALSAFKWYAVPQGGRSQKFYARRSVGDGQLLMHRVLLDAPAGMVVDHRNGNGLDNRRENLRLCTQAQNAQNRTDHIRPTWYGVRPVRAGWVAEFKGARLGLFSTPSEAGAAYDDAARKAYGEFARLNTPAAFRFPTLTPENAR